jgi:hypothetical protein
VKEKRLEKGRAKEKARVTDSERGLVKVRVRVKETARETARETVREMVKAKASGWAKVSRMRANRNWTPKAWPT